MEIKGWQYYNHAAIPTGAPHEKPDLTPLKDKSIWKIDGGTPFLARWTTDFDCGFETNWWYVIKGDPFDISKLKAKRRYEINKGTKNFEVVRIDPSQHKESIYNVQVAAFSAYPEKYRPTVDKSGFMAAMDRWESFVILGAFSRTTGELAGYTMLKIDSSVHIAFNVLKTNPLYEKDAVNAALVEGVLRYFNEFLVNGGFICDGARSINHETAFQDYLEKYFGFRKAYCKLHIEYNPKVKWIVKILFPFRSFLNKLDRISAMHQLNGVLKMEEIVRDQKNSEKQ